MMALEVGVVAAPVVVVVMDLVGIMLVLLVMEVGVVVEKVEE